MPHEHLDQQTIDQIWLETLTHGSSQTLGGKMSLRQFQSMMKLLPKNPRCRVCYVPFEGIGGALARHVLGMDRSNLNPSMCNACEKFANKYRGGAEIEISMLFADVRGSTTLAEGMSPLVFGRLIDRFYGIATDILIDANAWIEKLSGDEVTGFFIPAFAGKGHAQAGVDAALAILRATAPWLPVGAGVHTGLAYVGAVGKEGGKIEITALGDAVNTAARLASNAGAGELLVSEQACSQAQLNGPAENRRLQLKGRNEPVMVQVLQVGNGY